MAKAPVATKTKRSLDCYDSRSHPILKQNDPNRSSLGGAKMKQTRTASITKKLAMCPVPSLVIAH